MQYEENNRTTCSCTRWIHDAQRAMTAVAEQNLKPQHKTHKSSCYQYSFMLNIFILLWSTIEKLYTKHTSTNANAEHCWFFEKPASRVKRCCVCFGNDNKKKANQPKPNGKKNEKKNINRQNKLHYTKNDMGELRREKKADATLTLCLECLCVSFTG